MNIIRQYIEKSTYFLFTTYFSRGLRMATAMILSGMVGVLTNQIALGLLSFSGALVAGIGDSPGTLRHKKNTQLLGAFFYTLVAFITFLLRPFPIIMGFWIAICTFFFSMFFIYGSRAVNVGTASLLSLCYSVNHIQTIDNVWTHTGAMLFGILIYAFVSLLLWRIRPYRIIEQTISTNLRNLADYVNLLNQVEEDIHSQNKLLNKIFDKKTQIHQNHEDIRELLLKLRFNAKGFSTRGRRMTLIFIALVDLYENLIALQIEHTILQKTLDDSGLQKSFSENLMQIHHALNQLSWAITLDQKPNLDWNEEKLQQFLTQIRSYCQNNEELETQVSEPIQLFFDNISMQIFNIQKIITGNIETEDTSEDLQLDQFTRHYRYDWSTLKANLNLNSTIFRHALRVSSASILAYICALYFEINYFSWILLTIILILKPVFGNTRNFAIQRIVGTIIGCLIAFGLIHITDNTLILSVFITICIIGAYSFIPINYKIGVGFLSVFVILMMFIEQGGVIVNVYHRIGGTSIAVLLSFVMSYIFLPTWEHQKFPAELLKLFKSDKQYFALNIQSLQQSKDADITAIKLARKEVLLNITNVSGIFQRMLAEPKLSKEYRSLAYDLVTLFNLLSSRIAALRTSQIHDYQFSKEENNLINYLQKSLTIIEQLLEGQEFSTTAHVKKKDIFTTNSHHIITHNLQELKNISTQIIKKIRKISQCEEWKN